MLTLKQVVRNRRTWLGVQLVFLLGGNYVGWSTIISEVNFYCLNEAKGLEALLSFSGTVTTNPLLSPCFWGSIVFAVAAVWTIRLLVMKDKAKLAKEHKQLCMLLLAGTVFAVANNIPLFYRYLTTPKGTATSCSPGKLLTNPFMTSCFYGFSAFAGATLAGFIGRKSK